MNNKNVIKLFNTFGKNVTKDAKKNLDSRRANSSGRLRKSIRHTVKEDNDGIELAIWMEDYGVLLDSGQLGHDRKILKGWNKSIFIPRGKGFTNKFPDISAIRKWIKEKPITSDLKPKQLSYLIARKIFKRGIQPRLFMSEAYNKHKDKLDKDILDAAGKDIDTQID